jgi:hypothetical protein
MYNDMEKWQFRLGYVPGGMWNTSLTKNLRLVVLVKIEKIELSGAVSKITSTNYAYIEEIGVPDRKNKNKYTMEHKIKFKLYGLTAGSTFLTRAVKSPVSDRWVYYNNAMNRFASDMDGKPVRGNARETIIRTLEEDNANVFGHIFERLRGLRKRIKLHDFGNDLRLKNKRGWNKEAGLQIKIASARKSLKLRDDGQFQSEMTHGLLMKLMKNVNEKGYINTDLTSDPFWNSLGLRPGCRIVGIACHECKGVGIKHTVLLIQLHKVLVALCLQQLQ